MDQGGGMNRLVLMPFARRADGIIVGIDDLSTSERGAACGCTCLSCGLPVIARMGQHNKSCFAHDYHAKADSERCTYSPETVIRIVMMDVLPKPVSYTDLWSFGEIKAEKCVERHLPLTRGDAGRGLLRPNKQTPPHLSP